MDAETLTRWTQACAERRQAVCDFHRPSLPRFLELAKDAESFASALSDGALRFSSLRKPSLKVVDDAIASANFGSSDPFARKTHLRFDLASNVSPQTDSIKIELFPEDLVDRSRLFRIVVDWAAERDAFWSNLA